MISFIFDMDLFIVDGVDSVVDNVDRFLNRTDLGAPVRAEFHRDRAYKALVSENEHLRAQGHNLNLYLSYVEKELPVLMRVLREEFSGMPGYTGAEE